MQSFAFCECLCRNAEASRLSAIILCYKPCCVYYSLHGNSRRHRSGQLDSAPALHQLDGLFHLHLVVEGNELRLLGALARNQALLHVLLVEAVQSAGRKERRK